MNAVDLTLTAESPIAEVWFLDVGQGDCTIIIDPITNSALLIDCPAGRAEQIVEFTRSRGISIHTVIATHWDVDHYGGIARVASASTPSRIIYNHDTLFSDDKKSGFKIRTTLLQFLDFDRSQTRLDGAIEGARGMLGAISWCMLAPDQRELTEAYARKKRNLASAIVLVQIGATRILIGGDAVGSTWERLIHDGVRIDADILRWPHHGADLHGDRDGEIRKDVLETVAPEHLIISTGASNRYGHPSATIVASAAVHSKVMCTQVTPGCFGYVTRESRNSGTAQSALAGLRSTQCAGSVQALVMPSTVVISTHPADQQMRINQWPSPLCKEV
ncbi:ComEC/Rec2 family competence protein [Actinacidiphila glaucinigra]|uniref:Metal-dependent hydrolase, beta-lactamase superfamily II n=1 Tax=Actinacidiphila glaucinigra TaxID=235986 RepID=A0A239KNR4_9ACTN|nr:Metal-dependent hydrolase, beta-lactamase superfamily II [Actinacidiphila glaucinigra]